jgi:RNAse (barnase) inhibitor barstar
VAGDRPRVTGLTWLDSDRLAAAVDRWRTRHPDGMVVELRGGHAPDRSSFFDQAAAGFSLPSWFGRNWDALADALTDLSWLDRPAYLLVVLDAEQLLRDSPAELEALLGILAEAAGRWEATPGPTTFSTLLVHAGGSAG